MTFPPPRCGPCPTARGPGPARGTGHGVPGPRLCRRQRLVLARRQAAHVRIYGTGLVAASLASLLTASGVGRVSCTGAAAGPSAARSAPARSAGAGTAEAGLLRPGLLGPGLPGPGLLRPGLPGPGLPGPGLPGPGLPGPGPGSGPGRPRAGSGSATPAAPGPPGPRRPPPEPRRIRSGRAHRRLPARITRHSGGRRDRAPDRGHPGSDRRRRAAGPAGPDSLPELRGHGPQRP